MNITIFKGVILGAAVGTLLGSLAAILYPRRQEILETLKEQTSDLNEKAKEYANLLIQKGSQMTHKKRMVSNNHWKSTLAGVLLGAGVTFLLTPKTGKQV